MTFFTLKIGDEDRYLYWDSENQILTPRKEETSATPLKAINNCFQELLKKEDFTNKIETCTGVLSKESMTCLTYLDAANKFLKNPPEDSSTITKETEMIASRIKYFLNLSGKLQLKLESAYMNGNLIQFQSLIEKGIPDNMKDFVWGLAVEKVQIPLLEIFFKLGVSERKIQLLLEKVTQTGNKNRVEWLMPFVNKENQGSSLNLAVSYDYFDIVNLYLENKVSPDTCDEAGWPVICNAAFKENVDIIELLLKFGANINATTPLGCTALHFAAMGGHYDLVTLLLKNQASTDIKDSCGKTALDWANSSEFSNISDLLKKV